MSLALGVFCVPGRYNRLDAKKGPKPVLHAMDSLKPSYHLKQSGNRSQGFRFIQACVLSAVGLSLSLQPILLDVRLVLRL